MSNPPQTGPLTAMDVLAASLADMPSGVSYSLSGDEAVIEPPPVFDIDAAAAVRALTLQLQDGFVTAIVFDLSGVTAMDNTALGVIHGAHKRLRAAGGGAAVAAPAAAIARLFRETGLDQHVPVRASVAEAACAARPTS